MSNPLNAVFPDHYATGTDYLLDVVECITSRLVTGSASAIERVCKAPHARYLGRNGYGDAVYDIGRMPREAAPKRLYIHAYANSPRGGRYAKFYVAASPEAA